MTALITGVSGQDGQLLSTLLLQKNIPVIGLTRDKVETEKKLKNTLNQQIDIQEFDFSNLQKIKTVIHDIKPEYIFNFAAKSTGSGMFSSFEEIYSLNAHFPLLILEAISKLSDPSQSAFIQASSREIYGNATDRIVNETTALRPISPYGAAKAYIHHMIDIYRTQFSMRCGSAIFFNHESIYRSPHFITRKIVNAAVAIKLGYQKELEIGDLSIERDWGSAADFMEGVYLMASQEIIKDYIFATGKLSKIRDIIDIAFTYLELDYKKYVRRNAQFIRKIETPAFTGDTSAIFNELGWRHKTALKTIITEMVDYEMAHQSSLSSLA